MRYFEWDNPYEKNNCALSGFEGGEFQEMTKAKPLAKLRPDPYTYSMDEEYKKNVRLTDSLINDQRTIVASERLRDLLLSRLGKKIEALPVWIKDHKGRIASKSYAIINILDVQPCLATDESEPIFTTIGGKNTLVGVDNLTLNAKKISQDAMLFRTAELLGPILIREDLADEIGAGKFVGMRFLPVNTI